MINGKRRVFIEKYLQCWNATEAARCAGYTEKYLHTNASKLLQNTTVKAEIERRIAEMAMTTDEVLKRLADQARGDLADFAGVRSARDLAEIDNSHIVKKAKTVRRNAEIETFEIELYNAQSALIHIGKNLGLFDDTVNVKLEQEWSKALDLLERKLDADTYQRVIAAFGETG